MRLVFFPVQLLPFPLAEFPFLPSLTRSRDLLLPDLMMEPAGDSSLEAAIAWLVQTILATLLIDKMEDWIRQVGLANEVERLQSEVERVEMVVAAVKGRAAGNRPLSRALARVKELLYDADDLVDELDYYRLQQQIEGVTGDEPDVMHGAEQIDEISRVHVDTSNSSGVGNSRSLVWQHFTITEKTAAGKRSKAKCNHCGNEFNCKTTTNGTSSMKKHLKKAHSVTCTKKSGGHSPNLSSTGDATCVRSVEVGSSSNGKRKRTNENPTQATSANTHTKWDKAEFSNRINKIIGQLQSQDIQGALSKVLEPYGPSATSTSNHQHQNTTSDQHPTTSSLVPVEVYGRVAEKNMIKKSITENQSDGVNVLPIVGIAGVGKTTLAQFVYNDSDVKRQFHHRIWVCVSCKFDEVKLTKEMLDFFPRESHEGISNFAKLQEILKEHIEYQSKSFLLVLDNVSDNMDYHKWNKLLYPFISSQAKGNIILVTTRNLSVAQRLSTLEPIKLGALENDDMWLLLKSCAFGTGDYKGPGNLRTIGMQIAEKLKGNPLAAVTAGALLRDHLSVDHWSNILKNEKWKSLGLSGGIMSVLKLSYDELPYHLQQCVSYCSIFPEKYSFLGKDLVYIWISQGFMNHTHSSKRLEEIGWECLNDLLNLGFFQQVKEEEEEEEDEHEHEDEEEASFLGNKILYSMSGLIHDFARMVSRTECATINGLQWNNMLPTIHHLSIITDSVYIKDNKFEENLRNTIASVRKLRSLVLLGHYDSSFFKLFTDIFQKAQNLRLLQMSATCADFNSVMCNLVNPAHLRYLKRESDEVDVNFPKISSKLYHLQILDVGYIHPIPDGNNNLVSLRHLVPENRVYSSIASIGSMASHKELHDFKVQIRSSGFGISQLQSMKKLVQLGMSQLDNVKTREEAYRAGLRNKEYLETLHLSWKDTSSDKEYINNTSSESSADENEQLSPMDDSGSSSEPSMDTAREVLDGLEPHMNLKHLHISGYNGTTSPTWLANNISVTLLQTLHLDGCRGWRILPSLGSLPFLTKLKLRSMREVIEVLVPSLEELVLIDMRKLVRCSSTSVGALNSSLRTLQIKDCEALKEFDLFENDANSVIIQGSWMPGLRTLILDCCPHLEVLKSLPPSATFSHVLIREVSRFPSIQVSSDEKLEIIGNQSCDELSILDDKILVFHNLRNLKSMVIYGCRNLRSFSFEGFSHLVSLTSLEIEGCEQLFSSDVTPEYTLEDVTAANCNAFPSLKSLSIVSCGIAGKWLSLMLQHAPGLEKLALSNCAHITRVVLPMEEEENSQLTTVLSSGNQDEALTWLARDGLLRVSSHKMMTICDCPRLTFNGAKECCPDLFSSLVHKDGTDDQASGRWLLPKSLQELEIGEYSQEKLQPCFPRDITSLKKLIVRDSPGLQSLQLDSCTALEELVISGCRSLTVLEGMQPLGRLIRLKVSNCPGLPPCLESFSTPCPRLETLNIDDPSVLTTPFCKHLTSLQRLQLYRLKEVRRLTDEQEEALVLLKSLQELEFHGCSALVYLPRGLHNLPSLKRLRIHDCSSISRLTETCLPLSLEKLEIEECGKELADQCRLLESSDRKVKITRCPPTDYYSLLSGL